MVYKVFEAHGRQFAIYRHPTYGRWRCADVKSGLPLPAWMAYGDTAKETEVSVLAFLADNADKIQWWKTETLNAPIVIAPKVVKEGVLTATQIKEDPTYTPVRDRNGYLQPVSRYVAICDRIKELARQGAQIAATGAIITATLGTFSATFDTAKWPACVVEYIRPFVA